MRPFLVLILIFSFFIPARCLAGVNSIKEKFIFDVTALKSDYANFYLDTTNLLMLGAGITGAAALANTSADREIQEYYRDQIRSNATNNASKILKLPGEVLITIPLLLSVHLLDNGPVGTWAGRSLRAFFLGGPAAFVLQRVTGAGRPEEGDSHWEPFSDSNGVSGHAFTGAVAFITAAKMQNNIYLKSLFYAASPLVALSRINDDKHFFSQAALGWYMAYLSASAVDKTVLSSSYNVSAVPLRNNGFMLLFSKKF